ncbi:MAG: hypothetical protein H6634_12445 [Anaerolineales bacterium]|nr:hypothetical protein [Anaerolineales bacterium]
METLGLASLILAEALNIRCWMGEKILHLGTSLIGRKIFMYLGLLKPEGATQRGSETLRLVFNASYENNGFLGLMWEIIILAKSFGYILKVIFIL